MLHLLPSETFSLIDNSTTNETISEITLTTTLMGFSVWGFCLFVLVGLVFVSLFWFYCGVLLGISWRGGFLWFCFFNYPFKGRAPI